MNAGEEMKEITFLTGNKLKIENAKEALEPEGFQVKSIKIDIPEIQAKDVSDVAKHSAEVAAKLLQSPVITSDMGLFIESLNGFPGVYTRYVYETIGIDGLLRLMEGLKNRKAYFKETIAYCEPGMEPISFDCFTYGSISFNKSPHKPTNWDYVFIPDGTEQFLSDLPKEEKWKYWSLDSYKQLAEYLNNKKI